MGNAFKFKRQNLLLDHGKIGGPEGLLSVIGLKYTNARSMAEKSTVYILKKLKKGIDLSKTKDSYMVGVDTKFTGLLKLNSFKKKYQHCSDNDKKKLIRNYEERSIDIIKLISATKPLSEFIPGSNEITKAEIIYCIYRIL